MTLVTDLPPTLALLLAGTLFLGMLLGYLLRGRSSRRAADDSPARAARAGDPRQAGHHVPKGAWAPGRPSYPVRATAEPAARALPAAVPGDPDDGRPAVLLADDQPAILGLYATYLQKHGYRVLLAEDGQTALDHARAHHPDVIVLDYLMGSPNGVEVARELKRDAATAGIPILLLTAVSYGAIGAAARAAGCAGFLPKPVEPSRLLRELSACTAAARTTPHA